MLYRGCRALTTTTVANSLSEASRSGSGLRELGSPPVGCMWPACWTCTSTANRMISSDRRGPVDEFRCRRCCRQIRWKTMTVAVAAAPTADLVRSIPGPGRYIRPSPVVYQRSALSPGNLSGFSRTARNRQRSCPDAAWRPVASGNRPPSPGLRPFAFWPLWPHSARSARRTKTYRVKWHSKSVDCRRGFRIIHSILSVFLIFIIF